MEGETVADSLDSLVDLIAEFEVNLAVPSHILVGPLAWAELRKFKTAETYNTSLLGAGTEDSTPRLLSLPVIVNTALTGYDGLVVDHRAVISATGSVSVATSMDRYFDSDSVALRATWRVGHTVPRPNRLGKFTVAGGGS